MPIYEYRCRTCGHDFEALVRDAKTPPCPDCSSEDVERLLSLFAVSSESTRAGSLKDARSRSSKLQRDKAVAEHEYAHHHHH